MTDNDERDFEMDEAEIREAFIEATRQVLTTELQDVASARMMIPGNIVENAIYDAAKEVLRKFLNENPDLVANAITRASKEN